MTPEQRADALLDTATINQLTHKDKVCLIIRCRILEAALNPNAVDVTADDIKQDDIITSDKNCVGTNFRTLGRQGYLKADMISDGQGTTQRTRKSKREGRNSGRLGVWKIGNVTAARAYLKKYGGIRFEEQQQLPLERKEIA